MTLSAKERTARVAVLSGARRILEETPRIIGLCAALSRTRRDRAVRAAVAGAGESVYVTLCDLMKQVAQQLGSYSYFHRWLEDEAKAEGSRGLCDAVAKAKNIEACQYGTKPLTMKEKRLLAKLKATRLAWLDWLIEETKRGRSVFHG